MARSRLDPKHPAFRVQRLAKIRALAKRRDRLADAIDFRLGTAEAYNAAAGGSSTDFSDLAADEN